MIRSALAATFTFIALLSLLTALPSPAAPVQGSVKAPHVEAELIAERNSAVPGKPFIAGLRLKLEPHWHVYWKNPGDAGLPVTLDWTLPAGATAAPIAWPYPGRIAIPPLMDYGYEDEVLLLVEVTAPGKRILGEILELKAKAKWLVCKEICLPGSAELSLSLPYAATSEADPSHAALFAKARAALPLAASAWTFTAQAQDSTLLLIATPPAGATLAAFSFFPDIP